MQKNSKPVKIATGKGSAGSKGGKKMGKKGY